MDRPGAAELKGDSHQCRIPIAADREIKRKGEAVGVRFRTDRVARLGGRDSLEKRIETGFAKVTVIRESVDDVQPSHHGERNLVNDSRLSGLASSICRTLFMVDARCGAGPGLACLHHSGVRESHRPSSSRARTRRDAR